MMDPQEGHRWSLRVRSTGEDQAAVYFRSHRFDVGAPIHFDAEYGKISALEYVLGAVGADLVNGFRSLAGRRRLPIDHPT